MSRAKLNILLAASMSATPRQGGWAWAVLQYLLGLKQLGHDVTFIDVIAKSSLQPAHATLEQSENANEFRRTLEEFGLLDRCALLLKETTETVGLSYDALRAAARGAHLVLNLSGVLRDRALLDPPRVRAYVDLDPGFTQLWHAAHGIDMGFDGHSHFVTVGMRIGKPGCEIPTCGVEWINTPQPIALDHWPRVAGASDGAMTTLANWRGYGSIEHNGVFYGQKAHSLRPLMPLPTRVAEKIQLALAIHPDETKDLAALRENRWELVDPIAAASTPRKFQEFIQSSKAEFAIAKSGYAHAKCGWFSDRSLCYLASGRPVVAQQTGIDDFLPTGEGVVTFEDLDSAVNAVERVDENYAQHCAAARNIAERVFDSRRVLSALLERLV
jgi:hypothetical protein